jgi:hypothetical protein
MLKPSYKWLQNNDMWDYLSGEATYKMCKII